jgi:hypothetical protein
MNLHRLMKWTAALLLISGLAGVAAVANLAQSAPPEPSAASPPSDGDFQALHKYLSDPRKRLIAGNGEPDADWNARRAFTYSIRTIIRVMPPYNLEAMNDDYQDVRVRKETKDFVELAVISYPLYTNAEAMVENRNWRRDYAAMKEYLKPGVTTNWDAAMQKDLLADLARSGINPDKMSGCRARARISTSRS